MFQLTEEQRREHADTLTKIQQNEGALEAASDEYSCAIWQELSDSLADAERQMELIGEQIENSDNPHLKQVTAFLKKQEILKRPEEPDSYVEYEVYRKLPEILESPEKLQEVKYKYDHLELLQRRQSLEHLSALSSKQLQSMWRTALFFGANLDPWDEEDKDEIISVQVIKKVYDEEAA